MQFLWLYIDELVGKGLSLKIILEFLGWGSITMLPLSLPLATLLASMMTLGTLGENNELLAIKAAGISLQRIMIPLGICCGIISVGAFFVSNDLMPIAFNKIYTLRDDIGKTKDEIKIPTGTFYNGIDGYILRVDNRNDETGMMHGVMVYNHTGKKGNTSLTLADSALMMMSKDKSYLNFILFNGSTYDETNDMRYRDTTLQFQKIDFGRQEMFIPLENYAFQKSDSSRFDDQVKSMNLEQLYHGQDSIGALNLHEKNKNYDEFHGRALKAIDELRAKGYNTFDLKNEVGNRPGADKPVENLGIGKKVTYAEGTKYYSGYTAGGDDALVNGIRGGWTYGDKLWQGFIDKKGIDLTIDLEQVTEIRSVNADFMQICGPGVFMPAQVIVSVSEDGENFTELAKVDHEVVKDDEVTFKTFGWEGEPTKARYVRYQAKYGPKGLNGFLFVDEIVIK
jgi:hypothetical protein